MAHKLYRLDRPTSFQEEQHSIVVESCHCADSAATEALRMILFPIGVNGAGMPAGVPFEVVAMNECELCGTIWKVWAEWKAPTVIDFGSASA